MFNQYQFASSEDNYHIDMKQIPKTRTTSSFCLICNAEARIINYGALSCYSCKTFFRRHSCRTKNLRPCQYGGYCEITVNTRKLCVACRFKKCLAMGMSADFIRKDFQGKRSRTIVQSNHNEIRTILITSLNLLNNDQSSLNKFEWNLLSNVIHAFDRFSLVPSITRMIDCLDTNIEVHVWDTFYLFASFYTATKSFMRSTADFRVLTVAEQISLFQRNLHGLFNFYGTFMLRDAGIFDNNRNECLITPLYGEEIVRQAKRVVMRLDHDSTLIKIIHMIFAFSTNCYTINYDSNMHSDALLRGAFRLLGSQNLYIEILWKYMIYRYGYKQTIVRFAALVKQMLDLINLSASIYTHNAHHQILVDDLVEEAKSALVLNDKNDEPLWGKDL